MAKIKLTETILAGAQQSLNDFRMPIQDVLPSLPLLDKVGYYSCEVIDRELYKACICVLQEDPWERIRAVAKALPKTRLQASFAGSFLFGDRRYPSDIIEFFIDRLVSNGISVIRVFDPMNDLQNLKDPISVGRNKGIHVQAGIFYTKSETHTNANFVNCARKLEDMGADSICLIDNNELLNPYDAYNITASLKQEIQLPIQFSTTTNSCAGYMNILKMVEAGIDMVDCSISPFANGASFPSAETLVSIYKNTPYDTMLDIKDLFETEKSFSALKEKYLKADRLNINKLSINPEPIRLNLPGDMVEYLGSRVFEHPSLTNEKVTEEVFRLRQLAGNPPFVFPVSFSIVEQAVNNLLSNSEVSDLSPKFTDLLSGKFGNPPASIDPLYRERVIHSSQNLAGEKLPPELEKLRAELPSKYNEQSEDVLTLALFPKIAPTYFETRSNRLYGIDGGLADKSSYIHPI